MYADDDMYETWSKCVIYVVKSYEIETCMTQRQDDKT